MNNRHALFPVLTAVLLAACPTSGFAASDALTSLTGMDSDSRYYDYEMRGVSFASLRLTQSLWEGGATEARIAIEQARLSSSRHTLADAVASLTFDAVTAHADVRRRRQLVALAEQNIRDYQQIIGMLNSRVSSGLSTPGDVNLVESRLFRAQGTLAEYRADLIAAEAQFQRVTGQPVPRSLAAVPLPAKLYASPRAAMDACHHRNPRLLSEQGGIEAARGEQRLAAAGDMPHFNVSAGPRWHVQNTPQDSTNHGWDAQLSLQWNLYEGGAGRAAQRGAAAKERQSRQNMRHVADTLDADILGTWASYEAAGERMRLYGDSMRAARQARDVFHEQYLLGSKNLLDLLDADNEYFVAASQHTLASGDKIIAAYRLLTLGGDILRTLQVKLPSMTQQHGGQ